MCFGGEYGSGFLKTTEEYDGTSWSSSGNLGTARASLAGAGTQDAALAAGGDGGTGANYLNTTEEYDVSISAFIPRTMWFN